MLIKWCNLGFKIKTFNLNFLSLKLCKISEVVRVTNALSFVTYNRLQSFNNAKKPWFQSWPIPKIGLNINTNSFGRPLINTNINMNRLEGLLSISIPISILPKKSISVVLSIPISSFLKGMRLCVRAGQLK